MQYTTIHSLLWKRVSRKGLFLCQWRFYLFELRLQYKIFKLYIYNLKCNPKACFFKKNKVFLSRPYKVSNAD